MTINRKSFCPNERRNFLKNSVAVGAASLIAGTMGAKKVFAAPQKNNAVSAWTDGLQYNPKISNLRTVYIRDEEMNPTVPAWNTDAIAKAVNAEKVFENMDKLAIALAEEKTADDPHGLG